MANANRDTIVPLLPAAIVPIVIGLLLNGVSRLLMVGIGAVALIAVVGLFVQGAIVSARRARSAESGNAG
ncbi:MAG: hypothetical protein AAF962_09715 [Actinomycetota bacterium]